MAPGRNRRQSVTGVTIYMEGGGDSWHLKAQLRQGMDEFLASLKSQVQSKRWKWKLTPCGGRRAAHDAFMNARRRPGRGEIIILLVDSEGPVTAATPTQHLQARPNDQWDLTGVAENVIHLMIQCMETWIIADPEALAKYFGRHFNSSALPRRHNLEEIPGPEVTRALARATQRTTKREYRKIRDASALLRLIEPHKVRRRGASCERMFNELGVLISGDRDPS